MHRRSVLFFAGLILLQSVLYGFGDPISKAAYETMSVYSLMTVRYAIAVAALLLVCGRRIAQGCAQCRCGFGWCRRCALRRLCAQ